MVDDRDPRVHYSSLNPDSSSAALWRVRDGNDFDTQGNFGPTYLDTLHELSGGGESGKFGQGRIEFSFNGTGVAFYGTTQIANTTHGPDPEYTCFQADKQPFSRPSRYFLFTENRWRFCDQDDLPDTTHTVYMDANVREGQPFLLDYVAYCPSPDASIEGETVYFGIADAPSRLRDIVGRNKEWQMWGEVGMYTQTKDVPLELDFDGSSLSWYTLYPDQFRGSPTTGSYRVDDGPSTDFSILRHTGPTQFNQLLFKTSSYPRGRHKLTVIFHGDETTVPLMLNFLVTTNVTASSEGVGGGSGSGSSGTHITPSTLSLAPSNQIDSPKISTGVLLGIGVAGLTALLLFIGGLFWLLRKRRRRAKTAKQDSNVDREPESASTNTSPLDFTSSWALHPDTSRFYGITAKSQEPGEDGCGSILHLRDTPTDFYSPISSRSLLGTCTPMQEDSPLQDGGRVVQHEDSGVRSQPQRTIDLEVPPMYSRA